MLEELHVRNYALLESVQVRFSGGLNILTGETGAGKSILIGALGLLLGEKADTSVIRTGAEETVVSAVIGVEGNPQALEWLAEHGVEPEDGKLIVRRSLKSSGKGAISLQTLPVTRADLQQLSALLFDVHGQHEHQSLLDAENHRRLLDRYAGCEEEAERFHGLAVEAAGLRERLAKITGDERERLRKQDILGYAIREIEAARLRPGEEDELEQEHAVLANHEKLFSLVEEAYQGTAESGGGALAALRKARHAMDEAAAIDQSLAAPAQRIADAFYELEDFSEGLRQHRDRMDFDPARLEAVAERLAVVRSLEKKYGGTVEEVLAFLEGSRTELSGMENWEQEKGDLEKRILEAEGEMGRIGSALSARRREGAVGLSQGIEAELKQLGMPKAGFRALVKGLVKPDGSPGWGPWGADAVEFVIAPNPGEPFKRLRSVASGGELARVMLSIKSVLAESDRIDTLIFDEVDAGIGGEVALKVGERLQAVSRHKQVLCITHLATIAVRADTHIRIEKLVQGGRTLTRLEELSGDERRAEIARMLSGDSRGGISLQHAEELLARYGSRKDGGS